MSLLTLLVCVVELLLGVYIGFGNGHAFIFGTYGFLVSYALLVSVVEMLLDVHGF